MAGPASGWMSRGTPLTLALWLASIAVKVGSPSSPATPALLGRRDLAIATYERAYEIRSAALGPEHPDTAATRRALAAMREPAQ